MLNHEVLHNEIFVCLKIFINCKPQPEPAGPAKAQLVNQSSLAKSTKRQRLSNVHCPIIDIISIEILSSWRIVII